MLPEYVHESHLDDGVRDIVININRIPGIDTMTNCEGHIWKDIPAWPTKDSWMHFVKEENKHGILIARFDDFCNAKEYFSMENRENLFQENTLLYTLNGVFESHDNGSLFERISKEEQKAYFARAEKRKELLLQGWQDLNDIVINYIKETITTNYLDLPYRIA